MSIKLITHTSVFRVVAKEKVIKILLLLFVLLLLSTLGIAQNFDNLGDREPFSASGNLTLGSSFYNANGREDRKNPFAYYITAAPTFSFYGFDVGVSFTYRDQQGSVSSPFQRFNFNPTYKWITLGVGKTSLNLSPYTLSGQYFSGASVQLTPGKFRFKAIQGNLENPLAQIDTLLKGPEILPSYKRKALAALVGYGNGKNFIDLIYFQAKDDIQASNISIIDNKLIKPEENVVIGSKFGIALGNHFDLKINAAGSAYTSNQESAAELDFEDDNNITTRATDVITTNLSTKIQFAGDASFNVKFKKVGFGLEYKRVDPFYKSLGTYYFQEDYQNVTLKLNFSMLKNKIRFRGSGGVQENNISRLRSSTRRRTIFNGSLIISPTRTFSTSVRVSNFQSNRTPVLTTLNDSLQFTQTTETYSVVPTLLILGEKVNSTIVLMINYQKLVDLGLDLTGNRGVDNWTGNLSYNLFFKEPKLSLGVNILANQNIIGGIINERLGGNLTASKKLLGKKLSLSTNIGYTTNYISKKYDGQSYTGNIGLRYKVKRSISIGFNSNALFRKSQIISYQEYRGTFKISYQFNTSK